MCEDKQICLQSTVGHFEKGIATHADACVQVFAPLERKLRFRNAAIWNQVRQKVRLLGLHSSKRGKNVQGGGGSNAWSDASGVGGAGGGHAGDAQLMQERIVHETQLVTSCCFKMVIGMESMLKLFSYNAAVLEDIY